MKTKKRSALTLRDYLSQLTYTQACKLLGEQGPQLIKAGSGYAIDIESQVTLSSKRFQLKMLDREGTVVTIRLREGSRGRLQCSCNRCNVACESVGAAFSLILEDKLALGLAAPPVESTPLEHLTEQQLIQRALDERSQRAEKESMTLRSLDPKRPWTDYTLTSAATGKTYRISLRGEEPGQSYCSCPDFRTNTLGTCKHIMNALKKIRRRFPRAVRQREFRRRGIEVYLDYGTEPALRVGAPSRMQADVQRIVKPLLERPVTDVHNLLKRCRRLEAIGQTVTIFPDAEQFIQHRLFEDRVRDLVAEIRGNPARHPLRKELLKRELLPYQLDGIAFSVGAGRAVLADDMGLGKTIQGIGVAQLLKRLADIGKVLIICPASLKSQWRSEIERFSDSDCQLVLGSMKDRAEQYDNDCFFTICNYEQVLRDILAIERVPWDLIILDEGQRIKNWKTKTSNIIKSLKSPYALVLSGTPLENRLDDLYSVVQFIDDTRLAPAFRFFHRHRSVDDKGKVLGYKNLDHLRKTLRPILLRRTRDDVMKQLPERTTSIVRITPTDEQSELHNSHMRIVSAIVRKPYLTEMDLLRLQKALLMCRMSANSTYLVDKQTPAFSSKLVHLEDLIEQLFAESGRKAVLFSEWTTMLDLIEPLLDSRALDYVRLDGSVPQKKRQQLVHRFQNHGDCKLFITTNAGSTGLNLQAANTVINVDLPWNPAILEQRVARAHRMGQKRPVQVFVMVTEGTIEENLLQTLSAKHDLALAALDAESDVDEVQLQSGMEQLRTRLERLLGAKPEAGVDESERIDREREAVEFHARRERVAAAGGELLGAAFRFLGELIEEQTAANAAPELTSQLQQRLGECVQEDESGRQRLTVTLPDKGALDNLAETLARLLATK